MKMNQTERSGLQKIVNYVNVRVCYTVDDTALDFILTAAWDYI
jgi:hypothetical protein